MKMIMILVALMACSAHSEDKTMCGAYGHDDETFSRPEKSWLEVPARGTVSLDFDGRTPMMSEGLSYCCFGDYDSSRKELRVKTGCEEQ